MHQNEIREIFLGGTAGALAMILPVFFHLMNLGAMFQPMLLPILLLGFFVHLRVALSVALVVPVLSSFFTGMPPLYPPIVVVLVVEGIVISGIASLGTHYLKWNMWKTLIIAVVLGKISGLGISALLGYFLKLPAMAVGITSLIFTLPGSVLQLIIIPIAYKSFYTRMRKNEY